MKTKFVTPEQLTTAAMVNGNEKKITVILDTALVRKRWVGMGWVTEGVAEDGDVLKFPVVKRGRP